MLIFDAHLDLAMNAMEWNRDLRLPVQVIRESEKGMTDKPDRGRNTVSLEALRKGNVGICVATQIARYSDPGNPLPGWASQQQAWAQTQGQLTWYEEMVKEGAMRMITNRTELDNHLSDWEKDSLKAPIGFILSLEGADSILSMEHLEIAHSKGLRAIGPAHYGPGVYAFGTDSVGGIGQKGRELLRKIQSLNLILDVTHLCDQSFWEALMEYDGPLWASHNNCRSLVDHNRQFSDRQIKELIKRKSVIGVAFDAWMLSGDWVRGVSHPAELGVNLEKVIDHIDHICQLAGNADHVGLGTDLDGAFGTEQCPSDLDTIADLQNIPRKLAERGYSETDINKIMNLNFINYLNRVLD